MKIVEGKISLLGSWISGTTLNKYSLVEIGGQVIQPVSVPKVLDNFMERALNQDGNTKLFMDGSIVYGISLPDGKFYCLKTYKHTATIGYVLGILLVPVIIGFPLLINSVFESKKHKFNKKLVELGAAPLDQ